MPRALLLVAALLAAATIVWLAWPTDTGAPPAEEDPLVGRDEAPAPSETPIQLRGGEGASTIPLEHRGPGALLGRVLQGGAGRSAQVSIHLLESFSGADPLGMWRGRSFLQRILDGGVAHGRALATTAAGGDGRFAFEGLASGAYELRASANDGSRARVTASIPAAGARVEALLELPQGGETLTGRVVWEDGTAFDGFVTVTSGEDMESIMMTGAGAVVAAIDASGRFVVGGLSPGPVVVSAVSPGNLRAIGAPITLPRAEEYVLTLGGGSQAHRGRVLDAANEAPLEGASVTAGAGGPGIGFMLVRTFTDAEGRFEVAVPEGDGGLFVEAEGYAPHTGQFGGSGGDLEVRLLRTATVTGRVVAEGGDEGVAGVWVFARPMERGFSLAFPAAVRTGPTGRFELTGIVPGAVTVFAMGGGWTSVGLANVDLDGYNPLAQTLAPGETKEITLQVEPAGKLEGRVVTQAGRAVSGAVLALQSSFFAFRLTAQTALFGGGVGSAVTGRNGRFAIDTLIPGVPYRVGATAVAAPPYRSDELSVKSDETATLEIVMEAARWLTLTVRGSDGTKVTGARVEAAVRRGPGADTVHDAGASGAFEDIPGVWHTDAEGVARVGPLPPGEIAVKVKAGEYLAIESWQGISAGAPTGDLADAVTLETGLAIGGRVVVPEGASSTRVAITVRSRGGGSGRSVWEHTAAEPDGTWRVGGLPDGTYEIEAELAWQDQHWEAEGSASAGDESLVLELESAGSSQPGLVVKIVDPGGNPVAGGNVRMITRSKNSSGTHGQSFSNGEAVFEPEAEEDEVWIQAWARAGSGLGDAQIGPIPERSGEVVVKLPHAKAIAGRVTDTGGQGVGGVRVETFLPSPLGDRHHGRGDRFALTDEDGRFELRDLGDGTYPVHVKPPPMYGPVAPRDVASGATDIRFELQASATAEVTVLDYEGRPVSGAGVGVSLDRKVAASVGLVARSWGFAADGKGVARLSGLAAGVSLVLSVQSPEGRDDLLTWSDAQWSPADLTVRLERAYVIAGLVRDPAGQPIAKAAVQYGSEDDPGHWSGTFTGEDGTFRIQGLEKGSYRVRVQVGQSSRMTLPGGQAQEEDGYLRVAAGTTDLVLEVDPGATLRILIKPWSGPKWGHPIVLREQRGSGGSFEHSEVDADGRVEFRGCSKDRRYDVFVGGLKDGRYVFARDIRVGDKELVLEPQTGGTITGRLILPADADPKNCHVSAQILGIHYAGHVLEDGTLRIEGVPPGTWEIVGHARRGEEWLTGSAQAAPGGSVEIELAPR